MKEDLGQFILMLENLQKMYSDTLRYIDGVLLRVLMRLCNLKDKETTICHMGLLHYLSNEILCV